MRVTCQQVEENLLDFSRGLLDQDMAEALQRHVEKCVHCQRALAEWDRMTNTLMHLKTDSVTGPKHHASNILKIAEELAPSAKSIKRETRSLSILKEWLHKKTYMEFMKPAFGIGMGIILFICVFFSFNILNSPHRVSLQYVDDIGFPMSIRSGSDENETLTGSWFLSKVSPEAIKAFNANKTDTDLLRLMRDLHPSSHQIQTSSDSDKAARIVETIISLLESRWKNNHEFSIFIEKRLLMQIASASSKKAMIVCVGITADKNSYRINLGRYEPFLHGTVDF